MRGVHRCTQRRLHSMRAVVACCGLQRSIRVLRSCAVPRSTTIVRLTSLWSSRRGAPDATLQRNHATWNATCNMQTGFTTRRILAACSLHTRRVLAACNMRYTAFHKLATRTTRSLQQGTIVTCNEYVQHAACNTRLTAFAWVRRMRILHIDQATSLLDCNPVQRMSDIRCTCNLPAPRGETFMLLQACRYPDGAGRSDASASQCRACRRRLKGSAAACAPLRTRRTAERPASRWLWHEPALRNRGRA